MKTYLFAALAGTAIASVAQAQFTETESNDTRAAANAVFGIVPGGTITGSSTASSGAGVDYFRVRMAAEPLGLYRRTLTIQSPTTSSMTASIRGFGQVGVGSGPWPAGGEGTANTTEASLQGSRAIAGAAGRSENVWYGFGRADELHYRVNGGSTTAGNYVATLSSVAVVPTNIGTYQPGFISMNWQNQGHSTDTDMWVYDSNFNAIRGYGNDDGNAAGGAPSNVLQSYLNRQYLPGFYYIAVSNWQTTNSMGSPSDDGFRTGQMAEFPDMIINNSTSTGLNMTFTIADSAGTSLQVANTKVNAFDINWFCFEVVPTPGSAMLLGMGGLVALRRRR
ncbi:MAG: hypothetical protein IPM33_06550 [Phycisphaerales bacterium]|nr:hypothetical protein [Phycisphaerales bacterium]